MIRKRIQTGLLIVLCFCTSTLHAQTFDEINRLHHLALSNKNSLEGFSRKTLNNSFNYHSFRHDVGASMLTRCENQPSPMEWETAPVAQDLKKDTYTFLWIAALNRKDAGVSFDLFFNEIIRFKIPATAKDSWILKDSSGAALSFTNMMIDRHGDSHGYMSLEVPSDWIQFGKPQKIRIEGEQAGKPTWIIVYEAEDALKFLQDAGSFERLVKLSVRTDKDQVIFQLQTPEFMIGEKLNLRNGKKKSDFQVQAREGLGFAELILPAENLAPEILVSDEAGELVVWKPQTEQEQSSRMVPQGVLKNTTTRVSSTETLVTGERSLMPGLVESVLALSSSSFSKGQILLMNSSHQDIAWMDTPEKCIVERDTMLLRPLFERAESDPNYRFDIEDALMIKEYLQRNPGRKDLVKKLLSDGRISCGATFIQPYEEMYSGEALARQFYFGAKWLQDEFDYSADTYWNVDVPGRTLQMPQLMKKAGVKNLVMTRQELGFYKWFSPDGSFVTSFSNGHYGDSFTALGSEYPIAFDYLSKHAFQWAPFYSEKSSNPVIPVLSDWDMSPAKDYSELLSTWNSLKELKNSKGQVRPVVLPEFKEALAPEMFEAFRATNPVIPEIHGERPALWLYIHGPSHQKAMKASREADIMLPQVEKLASINALLEGSFKSYPTKNLEEAWEAKIYPDHGWGGKGGEITDALFWSKYEFARSESEKMLSLELNKLASKVETDVHKGRPILVFNTLSWKRSSPVSMLLSFDPGKAFDVEVVLDNGLVQASQLSDVSTYPDGSLRSAQLIFIGTDLPSVGYRLYYLREKPNREAVPMPKSGKRIESQNYIIELGSGGVNRIYDKDLEKELILAEGLKAGEVFTLRSIGNGAGEFSQVQQPDMEGFDKTSLHGDHWVLQEDGPVYTKYQARTPIRNAVVEQSIIVYKALKKIDFEIALLNWEGILFREYRMALPINAQKGKVVYEVPYGKLEVGKDEMQGMAGERYTTPAVDIHPRAMMNWINVSDDKMGITLSSTVVGVDYVDPTSSNPNATLIQPILIASRRSCHGEGNEYLQTGDHYFSFSLTSHAPGYENGYHFGLEANEKPLVALDFKPYEFAELPVEKSFFTTSNSNVILSVIKKAEDTNDLIIRAFEVEGIPTDLRIQTDFNLKSFQRTNLIEQSQIGGKIQKLSDPWHLGSYAIETIRLVK